MWTAANVVAAIVGGPLGYYFVTWALGLFPRDRTQSGGKPWVN